MERNNRIDGALESVSGSMNKKITVLVQDLIEAISRII